jgi:ornithine--oxo-acid transaminase
VPVAALLTRKSVFEKVYSRMDRAMAHGSTFGKNDLAMAAGLATLQILKDERIIENAARTGERLLASFRQMAERYELIKEVRGKGLMIGIEFGAPRSFKLRATWTALQAMNSELFPQIIIIPLFKEHKVLSQVAGHGINTIKVQPALIITDDDCAWIERSFDTVVSDAHRGPAAALSLGRTLVDHAMKARATA